MLASLAFLLSSKMCGPAYEEKCLCCVPAYGCLPSQVGITAASATAYGFLLHVLDRQPGRKPCGSSMETWCVCLHLLF